MSDAPNTGATVDAVIEASGLATVPSGTRCSGQCCKHFPLPFGPVELWAEYLAVKKGEPTRFPPSEIEKVAEMVIFLGRERGRFSDEMLFFYTCRYYDAATGNCTNYENRPAMCSDYPYGKPCEHGDACTWEEGRNGTHRRHLPVIRETAVKEYYDAARPSIFDASKETAA